MLRLLSKEVENTNSTPRNHQAPRGWCYVLLLDLPLHLIQQLIGADGLGSKAVVLPPCPDGGSGGQASRHPLLHAGAVDGQHRLACCAQQLVDEGQCQHNSAGDGRGGDGGGVVLSDVCVHNVSSFLQLWMGKAQALLYNSVPVPLPPIT